MINKMNAKKIVLFVVLVAIIQSAVPLTYPVFGEEYEVEILAIDTGRYVYDMWWHIGWFVKEDSVGTKVTLRNNTPDPKEVIIGVGLMDDLNVPIGFEEMTVTIQPYTTQDYFPDPLVIPKWAYVGIGEAYANAFTPDGVPYCPEKSTFFGLYGTYRYWLTVETRVTPGSEMITGVPVWIDGVEYSSLVNEEVLKGIRIVKVAEGFETGAYRYEFDHWQDGSVDNPRALTVTSNKTMTAYYTEAYYLTVRTRHKSGTEITEVQVWIDGEVYYSPVTVSLPAGTHTVEVPSIFFRVEGPSGHVYKYEFNQWNDGSTANPKTIDLQGDTELTAYYKRRG